MLNGIWTESYDENSIFSIYNDTIQYTEHPDEPYIFRIADDFMIIDFHGYIDTIMIVRLNDSLLDLKDPDDNEITHLLKIKEARSNM
jgi:hypothetical protein